MNKEQLEARLQQLELERISLMSSYDGAIQDCKYWLAKLEKGETDVQSDTDQLNKPNE